MSLGFQLIAEILFVFYITALLFLFCYGLVQIHLVYNYLRHKKIQKTAYPALQKFPFVTIQLPVYNESLVIERLIDATAAFDYPKDRFEIQILDDSTDNTTAIIADKIKEYRAHGLQIMHIRRASRAGFKAGALQAGLLLAQGDFIAIFDADFVPQKDFLLQTIPPFSDEKIGMVQTRWSHLNKNFSLLTHFQAFLLDAHFSIEQSGRNNAGYFINFSGTGGVWRKACMLDAGGWHADTLTEDFDLSYRAQLKGWHFKYIENVSVPAELPPLMSALKTQQYRWVKGNAETARKHLKEILCSPLSIKAKLNACFHLLVGIVFISVFTASFVSVPLLYLKPFVPQLNVWFQYASFSLISLLCLGVFHYVSTVLTGFDKAATKQYFFKTFPLYLAYSMGISLNNALAAAEGLLGIKSVFVRTPKFNVSDAKAAIIKHQHKQKNTLLKFEVMLVFYFLGGAALAFYHNDFTMFPYHLMLAFGFGIIVFYSIQEQPITLYKIFTKHSFFYKLIQKPAKA